MPARPPEMIVARATIAGQHTCLSCGVRGPAAVVAQPDGGGPLLALCRACAHDRPSLTALVALLEQATPADCPEQLPARYRAVLAAARVTPTPSFAPPRGQTIAGCRRSWPLTVPQNYPLPRPMAPFVRYSPAWQPLTPPVANRAGACRYAPIDRRRR